MLTPNESIDILLTTYNSEQYLLPLIESILNQTYTNWRLLVRDDGSSDSTVDILTKISNENSDKIYLLLDEMGNQGPAHSFEILLLASNASYIMFCDHDDIWNTTKIELTYSKMKKMECLHRNKSILVHTDLTVVDNNLKLISDSFWKYTKAQPEFSCNFYRLAVNNSITGCTVMINDKTKSFVLPFPQNIIMHDWWIALNVAKNGIIGHLSESTILYRQHSFNTLGAKKISTNYFINRILKIRLTIIDNWNWYLMIQELNFSVNYFKLFYFKLISIYNRI